MCDVLENGGERRDANATTNEHGHLVLVPILVTFAIRPIQENLNGQIPTRVQCKTVNPVATNVSSQQAKRRHDRQRLSEFKRDTTVEQSLELFTCQKVLEQRLQLHHDDDKISNILPSLIKWTGSTCASLSGSARSSVSAPPHPESSCKLLFSLSKLLAEAHLSTPIFNAFLIYCSLNLYFCFTHLSRSGSTRCVLSSM